MFECEKPYEVRANSIWQCVSNHRHNAYTHVYIGVGKAIEFEWEDINEHQES